MEERKSKPNFFKDESGEKKIFWEIIAVKPKLYNILWILKDDFDKEDAVFEQIIRAKGIPRDIAMLLKHEEFRQCVLEEMTFEKKWPTIAMKDFILTTEQVSKLALSSGDTKRFWTCNQHSLPFGHFEIENLKPGFCKFCQKDQVEREERKMKRKRMCYGHATTSEASTAKKQKTV